MHQKGETYVAPAIWKFVVGVFWVHEVMKKFAKNLKKQCFRIFNQYREQILNDFHGTGSLMTGRVHGQACRPIAVKETRQRTTSIILRRNQTPIYHAPLENEQVVVCQTMFFNTFGVSDRRVRTPNVL